MIKMRVKVENDDRTIKSLGKEETVKKKKKKIRKGREGEG